jgi:hypothetical protein
LRLLKFLGLRGPGDLRGERERSRSVLEESIVTGFTRKVCGARRKVEWR